MGPNKQDVDMIEEQRDRQQRARRLAEDLAARAALNDRNASDLRLGRRRRQKCSLRYRVLITSAGHARASTRSCHSLILPSRSMTTPTRAAPLVGSTLAPYAVPMERSVSLISGKLKLNFSANFLLSAWLSNEAPRMTAFLASYWAFRSRNPQPSAVHPGVSALG
jgi:hypothetical protein